MTTTCHSKYDSTHSNTVRVGILMFIGCFYVSMLRIHYSVILLLYSNIAPYNIKNNCTKTKAAELELLNEKERFLNPWQVALVFAVYDLGASLTLLFARQFQKVCGYTVYIGVAMLCSAILTMLTPLAVILKNLYLLVLVRFLTGALLSPIFPMINNLLTRWSPTSERNTYGVILLGSSIGIFTTILVYGNVILQLKHNTAYLMGTIVIIWCTVWLLYVKDDPEMHERITPEELEEIVRQRTTSVLGTTNRIRIPWREILRSSKIKSLALLIWCNTWNLVFFMDYLPMFYSQTTSNSFTEVMDWVALTLFARFLGSIICLPIIKHLLITNMLSITVVRKIFTVFSHIIPGTIALGTLATDCLEIANIIKIMAIMVFNGAFVAGGFINVMDLTPHFAKNIYTPMMSVTGFSGCIMPFVVGYILEYCVQRTSWRILSAICGAVYLLGGTVYIIFGSASIQSWDVAYATRFSLTGIYIDNEDVDIQT
ncbi:hypothetical protein FQR65_LT01767 [Abscondita terminalis]|nr:hypothetical protein FQR65_LT01767 [Abscondita terminalis]